MDESNNNLNKQEPVEDVSEAPETELETEDLDEDLAEEEADDEPKKKLSGKKKALIIAAAAVFVLIVAVGGLMVYMFGGLTTDGLVSRMSAKELGATQGTSIVRGSADTDEALSADKVINNDYEDILLPDDVKVFIGEGKENTSTLLPGAEKIKVFAMYGTDLDDLSDCVIICALDPVHHKIKLISVARDSYVYFSDYGINSKINHAYAWGGPAMAIKVLNENFYLNIEDYVSVDWDQMQNIVNYLHGVWVYLDHDEWEAIGSPERYRYNQWVKLYGLHARKYAGLRSIDSDFQRISRQQEILNSMFSIARNVKFSRYPGLIRYGLQMCTTSFGYSDIVDMSTIMLDEDLTLETYTFPPDDDTYAWGGFIDDVFYFVYDTDKASDEIYKIIYEDLYVSGYVEEITTEEETTEEEPEESPKASTSYAATTPQYQPSVRPEDTDNPEIGTGNVPEDEKLTPDGKKLPEISEAPVPSESVQPSAQPSDDSFGSIFQPDPSENPEAEESPAPSVDAEPSASPSTQPGTEPTESPAESPTESPTAEPQPSDDDFGSILGF